MKTWLVSFGKVLLLTLIASGGVEGKAKVRDVEGDGAAIETENCVCSGSNKGLNPAGIARFQNASLFPADYGTSCKAWDKIDCPKAWPGETYGPWCCLR